ncbi:MAG: alpha/beta hydrolase [Verrucomicrobiales bacterium]|nr:alpha/beta hydrolase [Verrucomicrobiales bacterium]
MNASLLHSLLLLTLFTSLPSATLPAATPPSPNYDWETDGVSAPDQASWPTNALPQTLGIWQFDSPTNLTGFRGDPPILASNLFLVPSPWGSALRLAPDSPACLRFATRQANTNGDFSVRNGTVSLWFRPDWNSGGSGSPGTTVPLVEVATNSPARTGWWAWLIPPGGSELQFLGQARGQQVLYLRAPVSLQSNRWVHLALTWSPTNSALFVDGVLVTNGVGATHWPSGSDRDSLGWGAGGDRTGQLRLRGDIDLLYTGNYPLSASEVRGQFLTTSRAATTSPAPLSSASTPTLDQEFPVPSLADAARSGLWIEGALGPLTGKPGGWIHGTAPGIRYELFTATSLQGAWGLDQTVVGTPGQSWTAFTLLGAASENLFTDAAPLLDSDQDGLSDEFERRVSRTNPALADSDEDGMPDGWEVQFGLDPRSPDGLADADGDGIINAFEYLNHKDPTRVDPIPLVSVRTSTDFLREGSSPGKFLLRRSGSTSQALVVGIELTGSSVNGYDYASVPSQITIPAGLAEVAVAISPNTDGRDERDETVTLTVNRGELHGRDTVYSATMTIQDNDLPLVSIEASDADAQEPEFGRGNPGEFVIVRSGLTDLPLVVQLKTGAGNTAISGMDLQALPKTVTIPAGEIRARLAVLPIDNHKLTGSRNCVLELAPAEAYTLVPGRNTATVTIRDVELPVVTVTAEDPLAEEKNLGIGRFKFTRLGGTSRPLTVFYHIGGTATPGISEYKTHPGDYAALPGSITIPAGSIQAFAEVRPLADSELETLETVEVTLGGALDYAIGTANSATVTIDDNNPAVWNTRIVRPTSVAGTSGPEGLIEVTRFGTVLNDMTIPYQVAGQRILKPSGLVVPFNDSRLAGLPASYQISVTGGRLGTTPGTLVIPKGAFQMEVGLKATLPSAEVKGASLVLAPGTLQQDKSDIFFLDAWHLIGFQATAESVVEGGQVSLKVTAAATDPDATTGTTVRFLLRGSSDSASDVTMTGASGTGIDGSGSRYVELLIPAKPPIPGAQRSATLTIKAVADGRPEQAGEALVLQYAPTQLTSALNASHQARPYAPVQIRDSTAIPLPPLDCDQDGFPDAYEFDHDLDPLTPSQYLRDTDRDGIPDLPELSAGTKIDNTDSDNDGISDFVEKLLGSNPLKPDAALATSIRDYVPIQLQTSGVLREQDGTCYHCHAPGMTLAGVEQLALPMTSFEARVAAVRNILIAPGSSYEVALTLPPNYKANPNLYKTYSAEILPMDPSLPQGFLILESDPAKPLLGRNLPIDTATFTTRKATLRALRRPLMAVDANRDGTILFDGTDSTSPERPYRFWVNNDNDLSGSNSDPEEVDAPVPDHLDGIIKNIRDLEDFSRLWIDLQGLQSGLSAANFELAFEWRNVTEGTPTIQIYPAREADGGLRYLTDALVAGQQVAPKPASPELPYAIATPFPTRRQITPGTRFTLPASFWIGGANRRYLLFEAAARGRGELVLELLQNGRIVTESAPIHLELLDVKEMYTRIQASPEGGFQKPYEFHVEQPPAIEPTLAPLLPELAYRNDPEARPSTVTFVHGWNMKLKESINFSETMFKRLWHAGYRGRFAMFRWPTGALLTPEVLDPELYDSFNYSEHRALVYGRSLAMHAATLTAGDQNSIICHSMGAMVTTSALLSGMAADSVLFFQAAASASIFDTRTALFTPPLTTTEAAATQGRHTPDLFSEGSGYRGLLPTSPASYKNYYNADDFALMTGSYVKGLVDANWVKNQTQKPHLPDTIRPRGYVWLSALESVHRRPVSYLAVIANRFRALREVLASPEILAFVARSRSRALGAEPNVMGQFAVSDFRDLFKFGLSRTREDHSGEFTRTIQDVYNLYDTINSDL